MSDKTYQFDNYRLEAKTPSLLHGDRHVALEPKVVETLLYLVERSGEVVSKDTLLDAVWPATDADEGSLRRNISILRTVLDPENPNRYIETAKGVGYRFIGTVQQRSSSYTDTAPFSTTITNPTAAMLASRRTHRTGIFVAIMLIMVMIAGAAYWLIRVNQHRSAYKITQLTTNSIELPVMAAAISPDGHLLAYTDPSGTYIRQLNTNNTRGLSVLDEAMPSSLRWFPDQTHLLVTGYNTRTRKTTVWDVGTQGGSKAIVDGVSCVSLSHDGRRMAYFRKGNQLWLANSDGSEAALFAELPLNEQFMNSVQFSFDNQYLLDLRLLVGLHPTIIEARKISGNIVKQLYSPDVYVTDFNLLADDRLLVSQFLGNKIHDNELVTFKVNLENGAHSTPNFVAAWPENEPYAISASQDGNTIAVISGHAEYDTYVADVNADGTAISNLNLLTHDSKIDRPSGWLADNRTILFSSNRNENSDIYQQHIDDVSPTPLVIDHGNDMRAVTSADQKWLFYFTSSDNENINTPSTRLTLKRRLLRGGEAEVIDTQDDGYRRLHCAVHSNVCVLAEHTENEAIFYAFDPEHGRGNEIARIKWSAWRSQYDWDISPDGLHIAYIDHKAGLDQVGIISMAEQKTTFSKLHVVTNDPLRTLTWDAAGTGFYISTHDDDDTALRLLHVMLDGSIHELRLVASAAEGWAIPSPDGKHLAIEQTFQGGNVWLLQPNKHSGWPQWF